MFNFPAQSGPGCTFKTARMDDAELPEAACSSQEASMGTVGYNFESPAQNKAQSTGNGDEAANESISDADVQRCKVQIPSSSVLPSQHDGQTDEATSGEQYIPLVHLMVPPPSGPPPRPPPPSVKPRKVPKGGKGKGCYHQLAANVAVELASMNESLHQKLRSSLEVLQAKESSDGLELGELEDDSYVFVNQQGKHIYKHLLCYKHGQRDTLQNMTP